MKFLTFGTPLDKMKRPNALPPKPEDLGLLCAAWPIQIIEQKLQKLNTHRLNISPQLPFSAAFPWDMKILQ